MKYAEVNKRFSEIVVEYIGKGYVINTGTMGGSQGEIARVDLTDGSEIIRVYADTFADYENMVEGVEVVVGRAEKCVEPNEKNTARIWNDRVEIISRERITL